MNTNCGEVSRLLKLDAYALLMEIDDKWISGKKYLDMSEYLQWQEEQKQTNDQSSIAYIR